jgi:hypothetical protein
LALHRKAAQIGDRAGQLLAALPDTSELPIVIWAVAAGAGSISRLADELSAGAPGAEANKLPSESRLVDSVTVLDVPGVAVDASTIRSTSVSPHGADDVHGRQLLAYNESS